MATSTKRRPQAEDSVVLSKGPCDNDDCGSSDACALYSDGHSHCFSCGQFTPPGVKDLSNTLTTSKTKKGASKVTSDPIEIPGTIKVLADRSITRDTATKYGVTQEADKHHYPYCNADGELIAYKTRFVAEKEFKAKGDFKEALLFGQHLFSKGGKSVTVTEGEIDAMAAYQMQGSLYPVVSLKNGAQAALKDCKANFEWLNSFDSVVLCFDADEPGKKAAKAVAELIGAKCKTFKHSGGYKDASDYLKDDSGKAFMNDWWRSEAYKPEGIVTVSDIKESMFEDAVEGIPWAWEWLTKQTYGRRMGELYAFGAGVGVGKTDLFTQQIAFDIDVLKLKVGVVYLEQPVRETSQRIAGKIAKKLFHIPDGGWAKTEYHEAIEDLAARDKLYMKDHFGAMDWAAVKKDITYFAKVHDIKVVYLDHLTALAALEDDERRGLDKIMAEMAGLAQELKIIIHFISHLTTPESGSHEEGARVLEKHFTGSRSIARWSHFMFGLERNKQDKDVAKRAITLFRILKDRFTGRGTGNKFGLKYDYKTGILTECEAPEDSGEPL